MEYDINAYFTNAGYTIKKNIETEFSQDITGLWQATIKGVDVYAYGETKEESYNNLINAIYTQVSRHRDYKESELKGKVLAKVQFINDHLEA